MTALPFAQIRAMRFDREGKTAVLFTDGRSLTGALGRRVSEPPSTIASSTYLPQSSQLYLETTRGDRVLIELSQPDDLAPLHGRPTIYLDQNHWSTLTNTIHDPDRVANEQERAAAAQLIELATTREVVLPMSGAHMSETCKQVDFEKRYRRALTIAQLSAGWQLRDPLSLRRLELRQALTVHYRHRSLIPPAAITLEPNAVHAGRDIALPRPDANLPPPVQWAVHVLECAGGTVDAMLDLDHVPVTSRPAWAAEFQRYAAFMRDNPCGREVRRRRTYARFIADLLPELTEETYRIGLTPEEMSDWFSHGCEEDLRGMPALALYREVIHEKLSDGRLRWRDNDLFDMVYLTTAAGYCDYVVSENAHGSHIENGLRRLDRVKNLHRNLRSVVAQL